MITTRNVTDMIATLLAAAHDGQSVSPTRVVVRRDLLVQAADLISDLAAERDHEHSC